MRALGKLRALGLGPGPAVPLSDVVNSVGSLALNVSTLDSVLAGDGTQSEHGTGAGAGAAGGTNGYEGSRPSRPAARGTARARRPRRGARGAARRVGKRRHDSKGCGGGERGSLSFS